MKPAPENTDPSYTTRHLLSDVAHYVRPYRAKFIFGSLIRLSSDLAGLYPAYAFASLVNFFTNYSAGQALSPAYTYLTLWGAAMLWRSIMLFFAKKMLFEIAEQLQIDSTLESARHIFALDIAWHERENTGNKIKRIQHGAEGLNKLIRIWNNNAIEIAVRFVGAIIILSTFGLTLGAIMLFFLASYFFIARTLMKRAVTVLRDTNAQEEHINGLIFEMLNNIRTVKVLGMATSLIKILEVSSLKLYKRLKVRIWHFQGRSGLLAIWAMFFRVGTLLLIIVGVGSGHYEVGLLVLFNSYFNDLWESVRELADISQEIVVARIGVSRMRHILTEPVRIDREAGKVPFPQDWKTIKVEAVSFSYKDRPVLEGVTFDVKRGERLGIVGLSGAGKTTLFKLLLKEYEDFGGSILVDGVDLKTISKRDFFKYASVVLQDTEVFNFSLRENISIANPARATDSSLLKRAVDTAHISDFMHKLPQGLDTVIGEKGVRLSGGERQRLGIARAIFKNPQLLLLDEATSHLDVESEEKIQDSLHEFFKQVTAVVIAHRLTTVKEMDRILVLENGKIIEQGTFDQLYAAKGRFFELWEKQKL